MNDKKGASIYHGELDHLEELVDSVGSQTSDNDLFRGATLRICGSLDLASAMHQCLLFLRGFMPVEKLMLNLYEPTLSVMHTLAIADVDKGVSQQHITNLPESACHELDSIEAEVLLFGRPDQSIAIQVMTDYFELGEVSLIVMPLVIQGERVGLLVATSKGAYQFTEQFARQMLLLKEPFTVAASNFLRHQEIVRLKEMVEDDNQYLRDQLQKTTGTEVVGANLGLSDVMALTRQVAPLDSPVLLLGETGVGKDVVANAIHKMSPRHSEPFIKINCGAIPSSLVDSELFGHERGAFTGALTERRGLFERADGGTLLLDEIGELEPRIQVRLLRVLQSHELERVGGTRTIPVNIRLLAATNRDLEAMVASGSFRRDLWFRINVFPITIPPLRDRKADIPTLVHHFVARKARQMRLATPPRLASGATETLLSYSWPGNVRELENVVERALILRPRGPLEFDLVLDPKPHKTDETSAMIEDPTMSLDEVNARHIRVVLRHTRGKIHGPGGAAELLRINSSTLRNRMIALGIPFGKRRK